MIAELTELRNEIAGLCQRFGVLRLEAFGSATTGTFRAENSDLDFLVEFEPSAITSGYADRYFGLLDALEQLFGRSVNLVVSSAITNPFFRESVDRSRALLYAA